MSYAVEQPFVDVWLPVQVVTDPRKIAVNYVKSWFVIDAVAAVPFDLLLFGTGTSDVSVHHHLYSHT